MRLIENSFIAKLAARKLKEKAAAVVIGRTVYLWGTDKASFLNNKKWVKHEQEHIKQYRKYGTCFFLMLYLYYSLRYGYYNNPLEVEARKAEEK